jgi:hypothetical protein
MTMHYTTNDPQNSRFEPTNPPCTTSLGAAAIGQHRVLVTYDINQIRVFFAVSLMYLSVHLTIFEDTGP